MNKNTFFMHQLAIISNYILTEKKTEKKSKKPVYYNKMT